MSAGKQNRDRHIVAVDYVTGQMPFRERQAAEAHLADCQQCQTAVNALQSAQAQRRVRETTGALVNFATHMIQSGATLIAPSLRQLPDPAPAPEPEPEPPTFEPLRVLLPHVTRGARYLLSRLGIVLALTVAVLLLPTPPGLSPEGHRALAAFVFTGGILALEPVALPIAALLVPVVLVGLGTATTPEAFEPFSRPVVFLILASLFLAEALRKHGLTRRLALATIVMSGGGLRKLLLGLMGITAAFSMWVGSTATTAMLIPVALTISKQVPDPKEARGFLALLGLGIVYSASLGGMVTIMGASANAVASGFLAQNQAWSFLDWMRYGLPSFLLMFPITWWLLLRLLPTSVERLDVEPARQRVQKLGKWSQAEREIILTIAVAAFFWVTGSFLEPMLGLPPSLLSAAMVAVIAVGVLAVRQIINWEDVKGVSWGIFFIIGAGLALGEALSRTGATEWFAGLIGTAISGPPFIISLLFLVYLSALLTNLMNNTTIAAVFTPILISIALTNPELSAVELVLPVTLATTFGYSLPSASARTGLLAATGIVERGAMLRYGLIVTMVSSAVLGLFFYALSILNWI